MIELTEDNIEISHPWDCYYDKPEETWEMNIGGVQEDEAVLKRLKQQILDNQEKAKKWDKFNDGNHLVIPKETIEFHIQNQKLRELIDEEIQLYPEIIQTFTKILQGREELNSFDDANIDTARNVFQKLLKDAGVEK